MVAASICILAQISMMVNLNMYLLGACTWGQAAYA